VIDTETAREALRIVANLKKAREEHRYGDEYCIHGTYVGNWAGPDYMCGTCEDGIGDYEYALMWAHENVRVRNRNRYNRFTEVHGPLMNAAVAAMQSEEYKALSKEDRDFISQSFLGMFRRYL
jgi:hypothetical protein